jgi:uncharacterized protein (TIGR03083 family)
MTSSETWQFTQALRAQLARTLTGLSDEQWATPSWCGGWSVQDAAGHVLTAAEQTPPRFFQQLAAAGFKFDVYADRSAKRLAALGPDELVRRLEARTTTRNGPPAPAAAMLGEIVVHTADITRPLHLDYQPDAAALVIVADNYKKSNVLIGAKRRIAGLGLRATDVEWTTGAGPEVAGPLLSLVLAMTGRKGAIAELTGDGAEVLRGRQ